MARWPRLETSVPLLIAITDLEQLALPIEEWAAQLAAGGVDLIQIREPKLSDAALGELVRRIISAGFDVSQVQVNNRPQVAHDVGCGVHYPERVTNDSLRSSPSSVSVHSPEAACAAIGFDFVVAGHVFATPSHAGEAGRGVAWLTNVVAASSQPVVAIGGIDATNAGLCLAAGASGVAVIRALSETDNPLGAAKLLRESLDSFTRNAEKQMEPDSLEIILNGKPVERPTGSSILDLLQDRELVDRLVVVEINGSIIPRSAFGETLFHRGDIVELVHFVGGG